MAGKERLPAVNVVVPMGGLGTRFTREGHVTRPKPFVRVLGKEMLLWLLERLELGPEDGLVICFNPRYLATGALMRELVVARFPAVRLVELQGETRGAAETVLLALQALPETERRRPTLLCDSDTFYAADIVGRYRRVAATHNASFVFHDTQPQPIYSYVALEPAPSGGGSGGGCGEDGDTITVVKEKVKISNWANSGCYCFSDGADLARRCADLIRAGETQLSQNKVGEFYTSGVIAAMLQDGCPFKALKLARSDFHVVGTTAQLVSFCAAWGGEVPPRRFAVDLEHTLQRQDGGGGGKGGDGTPAPDPHTVAFCRRAYAQGHTVVVHTTSTERAAPAAWLERHGVPCDELCLGKPEADFVVDNRSVDALRGDLDKQLGFYADSKPATSKVVAAKAGPEPGPGLASEATAVSNGPSVWRAAAIFGAGVCAGLVLSVPLARVRRP